MSVWITTTLLYRTIIDDSLSLQPVNSSSNFYFVVIVYGRLQPVPHNIVALASVFSN